MKSTFFTLMLFISISRVYANSTNQIELPKHYKIEQTFSGDISDTESFHLIFTKNRRTYQYELFTYFYDGTNIVQTKTLRNTEPLNMITYFQNGDVTTLLLGFKLKKEHFIKRFDINRKTLKVVEGGAIAHKDLAESVRKKDHALLLYMDKEVFKIVVKSADPAADIVKEFDITDKSNKLSLMLNDNHFSPVNIDEFVANGATRGLKTYYKGSTLFITNELQEKYLVELCKIDLAQSEPKPEFIKFKPNDDKQYKKLSSYIFGNFLFQLGVNKEDGAIIVWDIIKQQTVKTIDISEAISDKIIAGNDFEGMVKFLKRAARNKYMSTITVNETVNEGMLVRLDYVFETYNYGYNWWFHHQFMWHMHMQQVHMRNSINSMQGFGPNVEFDAQGIMLVESEKHYFELLLDSECNLLEPKSSQTVYKKLVKKDYIDKLNENLSLKHESSCFLRDQFRYIAYNKRAKKFEIIDEVLK